jgi:DNA-binding XRE family transcriptional regulator
MRTQTTGESVEINLSVIVPASESKVMEEALKGMLALAGHKIRWLNDEGEELIPAEEVFPDSHPGSRLRGLRGREGLSQRAMAEQLGIRQHHIAEMESGRRSISVDMAKRIGETFNISYKIFL